MVQKNQKKTLCQKCHYHFDQSTMHEICKEYIRGYLINQYRDWNEEDLIYKKT